MAKQTNKGTGDDILLNIKVTGRDELKGTTNEAGALKDKLNEVGGADVSKPATSLKTQLREATLEAQKLFAAGKQNTVEYTNAAKKVTALKNDMDELNNTFKAFDPDNKFRVFANAASAGARAVQGYAGAMAFLGVESEDATQTIAKLQGIMAFADAIDSLGDLKDSYNDVLRMLGLTTTAAQSTATATEAAAEVQISAELRLEAARAQAAAANEAVQTSLVAIQAEGLSATTALTAAEQSYLVATTERTEATAALIAVQAELNGQTTAATVGATSQATALGGVVVAEEAATVASVTLGTALKAIGIGLIVSAIALLVANFDKVKETLAGLFPGLKEGAGLFDGFKQAAYGVGNVILQFVVTPIKVVIDLLRGDFKEAINDIKTGVDVVGNYNKSASKEAAAQNEERRIDRIKKEIAANERIIKERKALGQNTTELEIANQRKKIEALDKSDKEYNEKRIEAESELTVLLNSEYKRRNDLYKASLKTDLEAIKANHIEALKVVKEGSGNTRKAELADIDLKYNKEVEVLNKRKLAVKDFNKELALLSEARGVEEQRINKKYGDAIQAYQDEAAQTYFSEYEKKEAEIKKRAAELLKTATPKEAGVIQSNTEFLLNANTRQSVAADAAAKATTDLTYSENDNRADQRDDAKAAAEKVSRIAAAQREAAEADYDLKKAQLEGHYNELQQLEADHEKNLTEINRNEADARKEIAAIEAENRLRMFDAVAQGASAASDLIGESTLAGKALAIASATINTYAAIAGQLAAFSGVPIPGYAIAQAIATGLVGLAQVKKLLTVNVPAKGGSSSGSAPAPVINSTVLTQQSNGTTNVVQAVNEQRTETQPLRAFIVNKDLDDQQAKKEYYESQSTY